MSFSPTLDQQRKCSDCDGTQIDGDFFINYDVKRAEDLGDIQVWISISSNISEFMNISNSQTIVISLVISLFLSVSDRERVFCTFFCPS